MSCIKMFFIYLPIVFSHLFVKVKRHCNFFSPPERITNSACGESKGNEKKKKEERGKRPVK